MDRRWRRRLIWFAAFAWTAAAVGDLSIDSQALASPLKASAEVDPGCTPNIFHGCPRYDDAPPR